LDGGQAGALASVFYWGLSWRIAYGANLGRQSSARAADGARRGGNFQMTASKNSRLPLSL